MKIESDFQNTFKPVTFTITVESEEELITLWQAFNTGREDIQQSVDACESIKNEKFKVAKEVLYSVWNGVDKVCKKLGLYYESEN